MRVARQCVPSLVFRESKGGGVFRVQIQIQILLFAIRKFARAALALAKFGLLRRLGLYGALS